MQYNQGRVENIVELNTCEVAFFLSLERSTCGFNFDMVSLHLLVTNNIIVDKANELPIVTLTSFK